LEQRILKHSCDVLTRLRAFHPFTLEQTRKKKAIPAVLEIPSKDSPYDPNQDSLLLRVKHLLGMV
jgi:vacuolar-type H+-ATPase subunit F/Vma7